MSGHSYAMATQDRDALRMAHNVISAAVRERLLDSIREWRTERRELSQGPVFEEYFGSGAAVDWSQFEHRELGADGTSDEPINPPYEHDNALVSSLYLAFPVVRTATGVRLGHLVVYASNGAERVVDRDRLRLLYEGTRGLEEQLQRIQMFRTVVLDVAFIKSPERERVCVAGFDLMRKKFPPPGKRLDGKEDTHIVEAEYVEVDPKK